MYRSVMRNDVCPQCKSNNSDLSICEETLETIFQCLACGYECHASVKDLKSVGNPSQCVDTQVSDGVGAYLLLMGNASHIGRLSFPWGEPVAKFFKEIFDSGEVDYGFVTSWDSEKKKVVVKYSAGSPDVTGHKSLSTVQI